MKSIPAHLHSPRRGFALIVVLMMMVLLAVIVTGLLSLSTITLRTADRNKAQAVAKANARLALMLAFGELQTHLGPDTRISARAETMAKDPRVAAELPTADPRAWWVGVSDSDRTKKLSGTVPRPVVWLVSGLESQASSGDQLSTGPLDPVKMIGEGSLDLAKFTGGRDIQAGRVEVKDATGKTSGAYAYYVDDNGMKAQLAASDPRVRNDLAQNGRPVGDGVLPGTYPLQVLDELGGTAGTDPEKWQRLPSIGSLRLLGVSGDVAKRKFFGYTVRSQGVLCDVKHGGLKKDLTIAFENPQVFQRVMMKAKPESYYLLEPDKLAAAPELGPPSASSSGYIHWEIFRDYYNLKAQLKAHPGSVAPVLEASVYSRNDFRNDNGPDGSPLIAGATGPHSGAGWWQKAEFQQFPYDLSNPATLTLPSTVAYRFNPITPILSSFQQNAWLTYLPIGGSPDGTKAKLTTHVQMFSSHYNPYNVGLMLRGDNRDPITQGGTGPRVMNYPQVFFTVHGAGGKVLDRERGLGTSLQCHAPGGAVIDPGRSQVFGFKSNGKDETDSSLYSGSVQPLVVESVYRDKTLAPLPGSVNVDIEFVNTRGAMLHGTDNSGWGLNDPESSQFFYAPFAWDEIPEGTNLTKARFGKKVRWSALSTAELTENKWAGNAFFLRSTREAGSRIRPLVDSNIRAIWNNPRWDSPLGLPLLASFSDKSAVEPVDRIPQMDTSEGPKGYTFQGAGRERGDGFSRVVLFDVPREDLVSLGQLQHAAAGRFSYEPTYIVGNSYANLRIKPDHWRESIIDTYSAARKLPWSIPAPFNLYDASYLVNERLWDRYIFTTIPQVQDNFTPGEQKPDFQALREGKALLANPRFIPYEPRGSSFTSQVLQQAGDETRGAYHHNAGHLLVDGAFNINSTSVDAWEAFLTGTSGLPVQKVDPNGKVTGFTTKGEVKGVRFPRVKSALGGGMDKESPDENYWTGFRELKQTEVRDLAEHIVREIRVRGPFLSLSEFVNRKLENSEKGKAGTLQAALDATVNKGLSTEFEEEADSFPNLSKDSTQGAGFPGQLLQGDVLQALSPYMQARSDTFTIRAYGEARNPVTGAIEARAWCEATVQRLPDPVPGPSASGSHAELDQLVSPTSPFGRSLVLSAFRWLNPQEV